MIQNLFSQNNSRTSIHHIQDIASRDFVFDKSSDLTMLFAAKDLT
jgi:hypothetical protein